MYCKVNYNLSDACAKPSLKTAVDRKTVAVDCLKLYFRFVVILPPKFEKATFSTNTGIRPKLNKNSEIKKEKRRSKTTEQDRS